MKATVSLPRVQTIAGLLAAFLSIGGSIYGYLKVTRPPNTGEIVTIVRDRGDKPVADAMVEVLTGEDALVTSFTTEDAAGARRMLKEGTYRLRVTHPKFAPEMRQIQVLAGHTSEIRFRLGSRPVTAKPASPGARAGSASRAVTESVENLKKIFR